MPRLGHPPRVKVEGNKKRQAVPLTFADMAELADALVLGAVTSV